MPQTCGPQSSISNAPGPALSLSILAGLTLACLVPFLGKAFHIDDPLFIWTARHIATNPLDCYNFQVNWSGVNQPMATATQNPPLAAYYMALGGALTGWSETSLHAWFLLPALALTGGTWRLARSLCQRPLVAALITTTAPVFVLSSTSVMCDTMMMALWVWAVAFWMEGLRQNRAWLLCAATLLATTCELTKYFGLCLLPLLLIYALMERRRPGAWLFWLLIPVGVMLLYQWMTRQFYGSALLSSSTAFAREQRAAVSLPQGILTALAFTGGCVVIIIPLAPFLWSKKALAGWILTTALFALLAVSLKQFGQFKIVEAGRVKWFYLIEFASAATAGASLIVLAVVDWWRQRTSGSLLLVLWVTGTLIFVCTVTWMVSGRYLLPSLPAAGILLARRLESRHGHDFGAIMRRLWAPLGLSLIVAMTAGWADYRLAASAQSAAAIIQQQAGMDPRRIWFEGHWGFQYYMELGGARPVDKDHAQFFAQDMIAMPAENSNLVPLPWDHLALALRYDGASLPWLTTMSMDSGAGYYSSEWGPLPFTLCRSQTNEYLAFRLH